MVGISTASTHNSEKSFTQFHLESWYSTLYSFKSQYSDSCSLHLLINMALFTRAADYKTAPFSYYRYYPSEAAAIVFCVLFSFLTIAHWYKLFRTRTWFFIPFAIGAICK